MIASPLHGVPAPEVAEGSETFFDALPLDQQTDLTERRCALGLRFMRFGGSWRVHARPLPEGETVDLRNGPGRPRGIPGPELGYVSEVVGALGRYLNDAAAFDAFLEDASALCNEAQVMAGAEVVLTLIRRWLYAEQWEDFRRWARFCAELNVEPVPEERAAPSVVIHERPLRWLRELHDALPGLTGYLEEINPLERMVGAVMNARTLSPWVLRTYAEPRLGVQVQEYTRYRLGDQRAIARVAVRLVAPINAYKRVQALVSLRAEDAPENSDGLTLAPFGAAGVRIDNTAAGVAGALESVDRLLSHAWTLSDNTPAPDGALVPLAHEDWAWLMARVGGHLAPENRR